MPYSDDIIALATPSGAGAIALIRLSGETVLPLADGCFSSATGKRLAHQKSHTVHLGHIRDGERVLDQVLVSLFKGPNSYTGQNVVEISCHGSPYIQQQIIQLFLRKGCRMAAPGEFTQRAFLNGKMDLSQAEAVADLIASENEAAHAISIQQMRGGFSSEIQKLRGELLNFASLLELELDFSEEDVEFADRQQFQELLERIRTTLKHLIDSFAVGNVIKNGIPVAIVGLPNVGKSTLLNALLNEERAIVSEIAGTTRDTVEDEIAIGGIGFRFIDTAGIRETQDVVEGIGIQKTYEKIVQASLVIFMLDAKEFQVIGFKFQEELNRLKDHLKGKNIVVVINKVDALDPLSLQNLETSLKKQLPYPTILLSAKTGQGLDVLRSELLSEVHTGALRNNEAIVSNTRHYNALLKALEEIQKVMAGMADGLSGDLLAIDVREGLYHLGEITGEVTNDELLGNIFANFCIGK
ncbi:MAG: tRNA uridine-5-carboxymethylaminomethyl(34) synthesis GTPase MnmE [Bacteroidota bacterium]